MLYDNALLCQAYAVAAAESGSHFFRHVCTKTIAYVLRDLCHELGGFFCGHDADSEGVEGKYYLFPPDEAKEVLGEEDGCWFNANFDITQLGHFMGGSVPNLLKKRYAYARVAMDLEGFAEKLRLYRMRRYALHRGR